LPSAQNALDIFRDEWASTLPAPYAHLRAGPHPLFDDPRLRRFLTDAGGVKEKTVLELGPLEAGHSYMLDRAGAAQVVAIEANARAFLKCLVVKELLGMPRVEFLCGDAVAYLRETNRQFDVCIASGILYHMQNPAELIALLAARCLEHLYLWTHYYDRALIEAHTTTTARYTGSRTHVHQGFRHTLHLREYQSDLTRRSFFGGGARTSCWMTKDDILRCLEFFGFSQTCAFMEQPDHPNGPSFALIARRRA
jgi:SAM-dependent methyltransferase